MVSYHQSVFLKEAVDILLVKKDQWYLDCTLGDGGHTVEILNRGGRVVGIDVDPNALMRVQKRLDDLGIDSAKYRLIQGNFRDLQNLLYQQTDTKDLKITGIIFDLGVSSLQLESPERGFSFSKGGPLDMRMDPTIQIQALDLVNALTRKELYELFKRLGEEKYSRRLADAVVRAREVAKITTTTTLAEIVTKSIGNQRSGIHPATKVFQSLRIAVNDELGALEDGLEQGIKLLGIGGRMVVISFHSLEDRIVKLTFRRWHQLGLGEIGIKKPMTPSLEEIARNPKSRSAKMRLFKKI